MLAHNIVLINGKSGEVLQQIGATAENCLVASVWLCGSGSTGTAPRVDDKKNASTASLQLCLYRTGSRSGKTCITTQPATGLLPYDYGLHRSSCVFTRERINCYYYLVHASYVFTRERINCLLLLTQPAGGFR